MTWSNKMENKVSLKRKLGFWASYFSVFGCMLSGTAMVSLGNVSGCAGSGVWLPALIAVVPMIAVACAYSELSTTLPGSGMIFEYTMPAMGRFAAIWATLGGYLMLVFADGGTQLVIAGLTLEGVSGVNYITWVIVLFIVAVGIHLFGIDLFGKAQTICSGIMVIIFLVIGFMGITHMTASAPITEFTPLHPEVSWSTVLGQAGAAVWWFIGFEFVCPTAEENIAPHKNIPKALLIGVGTIIILDLMFGLAAVQLVDLGELVSSATPQIVVATAVLGSSGNICMTIITVFAAFTSSLVHLVSLPRFLYGLAYEDCAPKIFTYLHPKFRTPWVGIFFTAGIIMITVIYIASHGSDVGTITGLVNLATTTWLISYGIALVDALILRKRYPNFPRLWKAPALAVVCIIGLIGVLYCIWTLKSAWLGAGIATGAIAIYTVIWCKVKNLAMFKPQPLDEALLVIKGRAEPYPEWDAAVDAYIATLK